MGEKLCKSVDDVPFFVTDSMYQELVHINQKLLDRWDITDIQLIASVPDTDIENLIIHQQLTATLYQVDRLLSAVYKLRLGYALLFVCNPTAYAWSERSFSSNKFIQIHNPASALQFCLYFSPN